MATTTKNPGTSGDTGSSARGRRSAVRSGSAYKGPRRQMRRPTGSPFAGAGNSGSDTSSNYDQPEENGSPFASSFGDHDFNAPLVDNTDSFPEKKKSYDSDELADAENTSKDDANNKPILSNESDAPWRNTTPSPTDATSSRLKKIQTIFKKRKVQAALGVGFVATLGIIVLSFFGGAFELIHVRENMLNNSRLGRIQKYSLENRRARSVAKIVRGLAAPDSRSLVNAERMASKFRAEGFDVIVTEGRVTRFGYNGRNLDLAGTDFRRATNDFFAGDVGRDISKRFDRVSNSQRGFWRGKLTTNVYNNLKVRLGDWVNEAANDIDNELTPSQKQATLIARANDAAEEIETRRISNIADLEDDANANNTDTTPRTTVEEIGIDEDAVNQYASDVTDNPGEIIAIGDTTDDILAQTAQGAGDEILGGGLDGLGNATETSVRSSLLNSAFSSISGTAGRLFSTTLRAGLVITAPSEYACRLKGAAQKVGSISNALLAAQLAGITVQLLLNPADSQRSGVLRANALNLFMGYMHRGNGYLASGGMQKLLGNNRATVSANESAAFNTSMKPTGFIGSLLNFANSFPLTSATACRIVTNGYFQVGVAAVGLVAAFFTGGQSLQVNAQQIIPSLLLSIGAEVAIQYGTALGVKLAARKLITGAENDAQFTGGAIAAGFTLMSGFGGASNGLLPSTRPAVASLETEESLDRAYVMKNRSLFDRYLNVAQSDSLLGKLAFATSTTSQQPENIARSSVASLGSYLSGDILKPLTSFARPSYAATEPATRECDDPQVEEWNLEHDDYCGVYWVTAPNLDLDNTERVLFRNNQIDLNGDPVAGSEYAEYIEDCGSGRPGPLYDQTISENGTSNPTNNRCLDTSTTFAYDRPEEFIITAPLDKRTAVEKLLFKRASAQNTTEIRTPSRLEHMSAWYGFKESDEANFNEDIEGVVGSGGAVATPALNNSVFIMGDSLTVGMQNSGASGNALGQSLSQNGWSPTIDAQGCRGVYQPQGAITGDGVSCPTPARAGGPIVDAITVANDPTKQSQLENAGTIIIALGTNGYETNIQEFTEKANELITRLRTINENANIHWLNIRLRDNGTKQNEYNAAIASIVSQNNIQLMNWDTFVTQVNSDNTTTNDVTWPTNDATHHDTNGYQRKVEYLVNSLGPAPSTSGGVVSGGGNVDCTGYNEIGNSPTSFIRRVYPAAIQSACQTMKQRCQQGVSDTQSILCSAFEYDGVYYGNGYGTYTGSRAIPIYGFSANYGNYGLQAQRWLAGRQSGSLNRTNLLECSGLTAVALYRAYNFSSSSLHCSGQFTNRQNPGFFDQLTMNQVRAGDFVTKTFGCNSGSGGHVAIAVTTPDASGNFIVYETNTWRRPVRFTQQNINRDFPGGWSRFKPQ